MFQQIKMMIQTQRHLGADLQLLGEQPRRGNNRIADPWRIREQEVMFQLAQSVADPVWIEGQDVPVDQDDDPASCE